MSIFKIDILNIEQFFDRFKITVICFNECCIIPVDRLQYSPVFNI